MWEGRSELDELCDLLWEKERKLEELVEELTILSDEIDEIKMIIKGKEELDE